MLTTEQILALFRARFGEHHFTLPQRTLAWARDIDHEARRQTADECDRLRAVERAARTYFERYCQDKADDEGAEWTGCGEQQHVDARALRDALAAIQEPAR